MHQLVQASIVLSSKPSKEPATVRLSSFSVMTECLILVDELASEHSKVLANRHHEPPKGLTDMLNAHERSRDHQRMYTSPIDI